jgi:hypothetical protein
VLFTCLEYLPIILAVAVFCVAPLARFFPSHTALEQDVLEEVKD